MSKYVALYGFVRQKDGLRTQPTGVENERCSLFYPGESTAAVISQVHGKDFNANPNDMLRHEDVISKIFKRQVILPAKFPKIIRLDALEQSMAHMEKDLKRVLQRVVFKNEYHVRVFMNDPVLEETPYNYYNEFSKYVMFHASDFKYKHYFPLLTREAKEAEFVDYAESVLKFVSQKMCTNATYWRGKSFVSEKVLLESYFWVRKHKTPDFEENIEFLKTHYPNLRFSVMGPTPPYNFVQLELTENL